MVVDYEVISLRRFEVQPRLEADLLEDFANETDEPIDHTICLQMGGPGCDYVCSPSTCTVRQIHACLREYGDQFLTLSSCW